MKRQLLTMGVLVLLLVAGGAYAQTVGLKTNVPFDFVVNGKTMPAGEYSIRSVGMDSGAAMLLAKTTSNEKIIIVPHAVESGTPEVESRLVFHRYGDVYFLRQIWRQGDTSGREVAQSSRETELARAYTREGITIAAELK